MAFVFLFLLVKIDVQRLFHWMLLRVTLRRRRKLLNISNSRRTVRVVTAVGRPL